ncbi:DUF397 domain-containing protein [Actinomadura adrarensis]|uniref:DUF397 domain-containing protein n=1 Tax=Actinomadura adrarensis TaxID=1819600 RepID=A0ABW3CRA2_9ACTN
MTTTHARAGWRESSYSGGTTAQSDCVEVACLDGDIGIRDSKAAGVGHLTIGRDDFAFLVRQLKEARRQV